METARNTYGMLLQRYHQHGFDCLTARLVRREGDHHAPRNVSDGWIEDNDRPKHLQGFALEGLVLDGHISSVSHKDFVCGSPGFKDVGMIDERDARRMVKTLKKVNDRISQDAAHNPEDKLVSLCHALKLSFVVVCRDQNQRSSYDDNRWYWMTVGQGRNYYRGMIKEMTGEKESV